MISLGGLTYQSKVAFARVGVDISPAKAHLPVQNLCYLLFKTKVSLTHSESFHAYVYGQLHTSCLAGDNLPNIISNGFESILKYNEKGKQVQIN